MQNHVNVQGPLMKDEELKDVVSLKGLHNIFDVGYGLINGSV